MGNVGYERNQFKTHSEHRVIVKCSCWQEMKGKDRRKKRGKAGAFKMEGGSAEY